MKYFDPMKETPEGRLLSILKSIEKELGIEKNVNRMGCKMGCKKDDCPTCNPKKEKSIKKYQVEPDVSNGMPHFHEVSGESNRAAGFGTNQVMPYTEEGTKRTFISEVAKMPSVAQTGYDVNASSLHMHLTHAGGHFSSVKPIEDSLMDLKKNATEGQLGAIDEIEGLIEQVYARL